MPALPDSPDSPDLPVLLVFSHHRWGDIPERPQQLMSRFAGRWQVVFIEEPRFADGPALLEVRSLDPALTVITPHTPVRAEGFHDDQLDAVQPLLRAHLGARGLAADVAWLCTPMALPLAQALAAECLVYDCADGLPALRGDLALLQAREAVLMQLAALVLTAGPSLFDAHRHGHTNIHCVRSGVDAARFSPASLSLHGPQARRGHALQRDLPHPRLGFFGVIDERLDLDLVAALADRQPGWSIILVGPVVGIAAEHLPQRPNLHWLGPQPDDLLPYLLAGWDLALMPYAISESTRFLSPTKTLEYMAGYQPIVCTPLRDVQALYMPAVTIAPPQPEAFACACEGVLTENARARSERLIEMARFVARHSWADAADAVHELLNEALVGVREARLDDELSALRVGVDAGPLQRDTRAAAHG